MERLVKKYARAVPFASGPAYGHNYNYGTTTAVKSIADAVKCCLSVGVPEGCSIVLDRALDPSLLKAPYITNTLVPLVSELRKLAAEHQQPLTSPVFASALRRILCAWTDKVLGPKPADSSATIAQINAWACSCTTCAAVRTFLTSKPERSQTWHRIGAPTRKHVEGFLTRHARTAATWFTVGRSPQGITVCLVLKSVVACIE